MAAVLNACVPFFKSGSWALMCSDPASLTVVLCTARSSTTTRWVMHAVYCICVWNLAAVVELVCDTAPANMLGAHRGVLEERGHPVTTPTFALKFCVVVGLLFCCLPVMLLCAFGQPASPFRLYVFSLEPTPYVARHYI